MKNFPMKNFSMEKFHGKNLLFWRVRHGGKVLDGFGWGWVGVMALGGGEFGGLIFCLRLGIFD